MNFFLLLASTALIASCRCSKDILSVDEAFEASERCVWHTVCDLKEALELKPIMDVIPDECMEHFMEEMRPNTPEAYLEMCTLDNFRSREAWEKYPVPLFCVRKDKEEERAEFTRMFIESFFMRLSEACADPSRASECTSLNECVAMLQVFNVKKTEEGECYVPGLSSDVKDVLGMNMPSKPF